MMIQRESRWVKRRQAGSATLLVTVMILFFSTIVIITASNTLIMEQRISGNERRARQSFEAAHAGLDHGFEYLMGDLLGIDRDNDKIADAIIPLAYVSPATYRVAYCNPNSSIPSCPDAPGPNDCDALDNGVVDPDISVSGDEYTEEVYLKSPLIVSCGWSDDRVGRQIISQQVATVPAIAGKPTAPLIAKGGVNVTGSATVTNYYTNLTIWSGGALTNIGNSGKTFVREPTLRPPNEREIPPDPPPNNSGCDSGDCYVKVTDKDNTGPDVIMNDPTLSNLTDALMMKNYLGVESVDEYRDSVATIDLTVAEAESALLNGILGQAVVVDGSVGAGLANNGTIGSRLRPVTLVIDGDWEGGNVEIHGVVYVTGNVNVGGNPTVYGAVVVEGTVSGTGSLDIVYDPFAVKNARDYSGRPGLKPGTWRDWSDS